MRIPSPAGWDRLPCAYLLLSDAYQEAAICLLIAVPLPGARAILVKIFPGSSGWWRRGAAAGKESLRLDEADRVLERILRVEAALTPGPDLDVG